MEAILLVGGQGTRLRPLTITTPKPMLPVANYPCTAHQIAKARDAGFNRIILSTSYKAEVFEDYFGDGAGLGVELVYVTEDSPLGTGGAIRNVVSALRSAPNDPVAIMNGDILSGHDLVRQVAEHRARNADVSLHLIEVEDPRPFGLVPTAADGRVLEFREKPATAEEIVTHQVNAGCYVFKRSVIDCIPAGRVVSVERETFPGLLAGGAAVYSFVQNAYWLDLGNPLAFVQGSVDLVTGLCPSSLVGVTGSALVDPTAQLSAQAVVDGGSAIGGSAQVDAGALVRGSVLMAGAVVEAGAKVVGSVIGAGARVGADCELTGAVVADGAVVGAGCELTKGSRIWPNVVLPAGAIRFSPENN